MPIVIADYSLFNCLAVFAPELVKGTLPWFHALPDGSINHTVAPMQSRATTVLQQQGRAGRRL